MIQEFRYVGLYPRNFALYSPWDAFVIEQAWVIVASEYYLNEHTKCVC